MKSFATRLKNAIAAEKAAIFAQSDATRLSGLVPSDATFDHPAIPAAAEAAHRAWAARDRYIALRDFACAAMDRPAGWSRDWRLFPAS